MMIHKIDPHKYYPEFRNQEPKTSDYLLLFDGEKVYLPGKTTPSENSSVGFLPTFEEVHDLLQIRQPIDRFFLDCECLFSIDDKHGFRSHGTQFVLSRHQIIQCDCRTVGR